MPENPTVFYVAMPEAVFNNAATSAAPRLDPRLEYEPYHGNGRLRWQGEGPFASLRFYAQSDGVLRVEAEYREEPNSDHPDYGRSMPNYKDLMAYLDLLRDRVPVTTSALPDLKPVALPGVQARRLYAEGNIFTPVLRQCETDYLLGHYYRSARYRDEGFRITSATLDTGQAHMVLELTANGDAARHRAGVVLACLDRRLTVVAWE